MNPANTMKNTGRNSFREQGGAIISYLVIMFIVVSAIGVVLNYLSGTVRLERSRSDMIAAQQFAQGGAVVACDDLNKAFTSTQSTLATNLASKGYAINSSLTTTQTNVYQRTISAPFTNQTVVAQLWIPNSTAAKTAKIVATATRGKSTQTATVNLNFKWGYSAAIISTNAGTNSTGVSKSVAQAGNVVVDGSNGGPTVVDGGDGKAVLANGSVNVDTTYATVDSAAVSSKSYGTANEIPDYTAQGTDNTLFDFNRFIAVADMTPNTLNTTKGTNHFTSLAEFLKANAAASATSAKALEGVIVVDIKSNDPGINMLANPDNYKGTAYMPATNPEKYGITVKGTLFFNFDSSFGPLDKIFNRMPMNINPADLTGLNPSNPSTYPSGYPATYYNPAKNPANIDITSKGFTNFTADDDLPAVMYSIGTVDMHGPVNISGVVYTPSYSEIENRPNEGFQVANQLQYFKGTIIVGLGIFLQNTAVSRTIVSYDANTIDSLATFGNAGKKLTVGYWQ